MFSIPWIVQKGRNTTKLVFSVSPLRLQRPLNCNVPSWVNMVDT